MPRGAAPEEEARIARGQFPRLHLVLVGVGSEAKEEQMEEIARVDATHRGCPTTTTDEDRAVIA